MWLVFNSSVRTRQWLRHLAVCIQFSLVHVVTFFTVYFVDNELQKDRKRYREDDLEGVRARSQRSSRSYREWEETPSRVRDEPPTPKFSSKG